MDREEKRLREEIGDLVKDQEQILTAAKALNRDLNSKEAKRFETIQSKIESKRSELENHLGGRDLQVNGGYNPTAELASNGADFNINTGRREPRSGLSGNQAVEYYKALSEDQKGKKIPVLSNKARLSDVVGAGDYGGSPQDYLVDRYRGFSGKSSGTKAAAMDTGADSAMVPVDVSTAIIDEARAQSRVMQAGALTVPMSTKTLTIARITQSATPHWKAENAKINASEIKTEPVTFTAKTLVSGVVKSSVELAEDSANLGDVVYNNLVEQLSLELDRAALFGSGTGSEPTGLFNATGVQEYDMGTNGAALESYAPFSQAYEKIITENGIPNAAIYSPRTWGVLDRLVDANDQPLNPPMSFRDLMQLPTSQVPNDLTQGTAENASAAFVGEFPKLMIGVRTNLVLEVSREAFDGDTSAWENLQIMWRAYLRADIQLALPQHFCIIKGIIPAS